MQKKWVILAVVAGGLILVGWLGWTAGRKPARGSFVKVDLSKSFNAKFTDTIFGSRGMSGNDLSDLPKGAQTFAHVSLSANAAPFLLGVTVEQ